MEVPEPEGNRVLIGRKIPVRVFKFVVVDPKPSDLDMSRLKVR